jgi:hypothetical protein
MILPATLIKSSKSVDISRGYTIPNTVSIPLAGVRKRVLATL